MHSPELKEKVVKWLASLRNHSHQSTDDMLNQGPADTHQYQHHHYQHHQQQQQQNHHPTRIFPFYNGTQFPNPADATSNLFYQNATKYFESRNISISELNITNENLNDFLEKLLLLSKPSNETERKECDNYCDGSIRDLLVDYKDVHGYISLLICIFGTIANILNIIVLTRKDMSKTPINKILKWLAVADMFVMIEYIPFCTYMYIISPAGGRDYKYPWAVYLLFHMHFTQILHTISISLTVTLAIWRFVAIRHPHGKCATYILSHCSEAIFLSFIISPILCFPTYFVFTINKTYVYPNDVKHVAYHVDAVEQDALYSFNFWVHSVLIKLLPCCTLTVISFILIKVLCEASKRKVKLKEYSNPNGGSHLNGTRSSRCDRRTDRTTMLLVAVLLLFLITEFPQGILGLLSGIMQKCFFTHCYSLFGELMDLLALINAAVGFVLYGLMSKQFRTSFKSLFFKTRSSRLEMTRVTGITTTCV